jgi:hypothetical protein
MATTQHLDEFYTMDGEIENDEENENRGDPVAFIRWKGNFLFS